MKELCAAIACLLTVFLSVSAVAAPEADDAALRATLMQLEQQRQDAYVAGDRKLLERQFAAEYIHTNLRGGRTTREQELDFYRPGTFSLGSGKISDVTVHRYGDVATLIGTVEWDDAVYKPNPTTSIELSGRFSVSRVYIYRDGRWQLAVSHASAIPRAATPAD